VSLHLSLDDGLGLVVLSRPEAMNSLTIELVDEIGEAFASLKTDGARAAVLAGEGRCFCAGADLSLVRAALEGDAPSILAPLVGHLHRVIRLIRQLPFPVVAAVEGPAVGAGMGLALSADFRVAGASAKFVPGYIGIGASPDGGVSYFLTRSLGAAKAASIVIRNRPLDAQQLLAEGLVDEVVEDGTTLAAASALARSVASVPPLALIRTRQLIDAATTQDLDHQLDLERELVSQLWDSKDFTEGVTAFLEKRPARYEGR